MKTLSYYELSLKLKNQPKPPAKAVDAGPCPGCSSHCGETCKNFLPKSVYDAAAKK